MCSICGIADFINSTNVSPETVLRMSRTMKHRGPDEDNTFVSEHVAFAHNRLTVIDKRNGKQPMTATYRDKTYTLVYNGELYNTGELRDELKRHGITLSGHSDTEALLYTYILFGANTPSRLNGIFAFAVYDHTEDTLFLCRDRLGVKPLYYAVKDSTLIFASEIKGMLTHPDITSAVDQKGLWQLLFLAPNLSEGSAVFRDIAEMKPGECGFFSKSGLRVFRYWSPVAMEWRGTRENAIEEVGFLMRDAIRRQLISDVPLCSLLSGGLDSSIVSSVAADEYRKAGKRLSTYSFEYEGNKDSFTASLFQPQGDDDYARYLADYLGTDHTVLVAPTAEVAELLPLATLHRDFPGQADIDSSLLYFCRRIKERHTVGLSGECADEIFGGYPWFYRSEMLNSGFFPWIHAPMLRPSLFDVKLEDGYEYVKSLYEDCLASCPVLPEDAPDMKTARQATWLSVKYFMTSLLQRKDRMSMASGLEVRVPFSDHRVLETVYNIPWSIKFEGGVEKALLRNAMADYLPERILNRKKSPYPKTHNPEYRRLVEEMLKERLARGGALSQILKREKLNELLDGENQTWFGQLMSVPQLLAWLVQFDIWCDAYRVEWI